MTVTSGTGRVPSIRKSSASRGSSAGSGTAAPSACRSRGIGGRGRFSRPRRPSSWQSGWPGSRDPLPRRGGASKPITQSTALAVGQGVETDGSSRAKLGIGRVAVISVGPNSRLRLLKSLPIEQRLALDRGTISAKIWAPPRLFFVQTPSALAVDLGCAYTLEVDDSGAGILRVETGWVSFERDGRESIVPADAVCASRQGGPGTPFYEDAAPEFRRALESLDFGAGGGAALSTILSAARRRDGLTLWHLLARTQSADRERVYERFAQLIPPPPGVTRERVLRGEDRALELWRWELEGMPLLPKDGTLRSFLRKIWFRLAG
jgi:FecR protein